MTAWYQKHKEIINYIFFGGLTTLVNWMVYSLLVALIHLPIEWSNAIAWVAAVLFAYVTNGKWVFESEATGRKSRLREFFLFLASRVFTGVVELLGLPALYYLGLDTSIWGIDGFLAKVIVTVVVVILNYVLSKLVVFRKAKKQQ